jgi:hypothetical protein
MALPWESAEASRERDAESEAEGGGDAVNEDDSETNDNDNNAGDISNIGNEVTGGTADSGDATGFF